MRKSNFNRIVFKPALKKAGLPNMLFHNLGHPTVTNLLSVGTDVISESKLVVHATSLTTINIFGHATDSHQEKT